MINGDCQRRKIIDLLQKMIEKLNHKLFVQEVRADIANLSAHFESYPVANLINILLS